MYLKDFYAFELMMAPYTVGHLKMSFLLQELGHRITDDERMAFYLTNTLDWQKLEQTRIPGLSALAEESRLAGDVKKESPILLILGNPPYSGHSSNKGEWIRNLIDDYKQVDGAPLGEANPKWLQDDYVKFLRFAQWKIEQGRRGVVGMITNHGYLDNPTFRGMRRSLMRTFDDIYVLDLHGNSLKRETDPKDGCPDGNVFDIRQGVAIAFFVKTGADEERDGRVYHAEAYGSRQRKYDWLNAHDHDSTEWREVSPSSPNYLFVPRDEAREATYRTFFGIPEIFPVKSVGVVTARDRLTIGWSVKGVWNTVRRFSMLEPERARDFYKLGKDARDWKVSLAQNDLRESGLNRENIKPIQYRPFDVRYTYYTGQSRGFICMPRREVMRHMFGEENLALHTCRQIVSDEWQHCLVTNGITDDCYVSNKTRERGYIHPLYVNLIDDSGDPRAYRERRANIDSRIERVLKDAHGEMLLPEDIFHYLYAILYTPVYRERYAEFLSREFPRVPFTCRSRAV